MAKDVCIVQARKGKLRVARVTKIFAKHWGELPSTALNGCYLMKIHRPRPLELLSSLCQSTESSLSLCPFGDSGR